jgi:hypothetical protein
MTTEEKNVLVAVYDGWKIQTKEELGDNYYPSDMYVKKNVLASSKSFTYYNNEDKVIELLNDCRTHLTLKNNLDSDEIINKIDSVIKSKKFSLKKGFDLLVSTILFLNHN